MLFVIGGVRGMGTAAAVCQECERANVPTAVIGIPKSIDNHILLVRPSSAAVLFDSVGLAAL